MTCWVAYRLNALVLFVLLAEICLSFFATGALPEGTDLAPRLDGVLAAPYLLFNEGYKASAGDRLLREELCHEAVRLTALLVALNRAVALSYGSGPQAALDLLAGLPERDRLDSHYLFHAVLGELHWRLNRHRVSAGNFRRALHLAQVGPEQLYLAWMLERADAAVPKRTPI